ncbi:serine hydrolase domain-containing protein [Halomonas sp. SpR8]|uniref:serine hydrolase domain-containing protein n=1 Tax=Halomonas sp. SpR8 TaxID=3050463 RepID=UPI0027E4F6C0|nr:serine hydrolase domain-containing protein [Halomonas sp. SpR8]MDQ7728500.1 serine hydrolase domain-containing protein [Halomonas sp. SpR8]
MNRYLIGLAGIMLATSASANDALTRQLDGVINRAIAENRIVGTVVLVAQNGEIVYRRAAGQFDREARTPMYEDAVFRLASITKPIVSATLMRLVEEDKLTLDDPVTKWLPAFRPQLDDGSRPVITLRQLLTHTSGLSYRFVEPLDSDYHRLNISDGLDQPGLSLDENLRRLAQAPLVFAPGGGWRYSLGLDVLGAVIAEASGKTLPQAVQEAVLDPLQLADTAFVPSDTSRLATPYADGESEPVRMTDNMAVPIWNSVAHFAPSRATNADSYPSGGAGMVGTAADVLRFLEVIRRGGEPILAPDTVSAMMQDQVGGESEMQGPGWGFGYGWAVLDDPDAAGTPQSKGTIQWGGAYGHSWFVDPVKKLTVVALTNTAFEGMSGAFPMEIRDAVYEKND